MNKRNGLVSEQYTIGLDLGDRFSEACVLEADGEAVKRFRTPTTRSGIRRAFGPWAGARVVIEAGTHSPWVSRLLAELSCEVLVANPGRLRLISHSNSKNDRSDGEQLARLGRVDPKLLAPIVHRGETAQRHLTLLRARDGLVRTRTLVINQVRSFTKSLGTRLPGCSAERFPKLAGERLGRDFFPGLGSMLEVIQKLTDEIRAMDRQVEQMAQRHYPETAVLRQVSGVGPITSLAYVLTLEDPKRFPRSRSVGSYVGLRPRQHDSGECRPQLRITKAGDEYLRRLLVTSAQYILGPFGPDTDLRRFGLRLCERGGKAAKKRAVVAVARKLAVLLHRLWITQASYVPLGYRAA